MHLNFLVFREHFWHLNSVIIDSTHTSSCRAFRAKCPQRDFVSLCLKSDGDSRGECGTLRWGEGKLENEEESSPSSCKIIQNHFLNWVNCSSPWCRDTYAFASLRFFIARSSLLSETDCLPGRLALHLSSLSLYLSSPASTPAPQDRAHLTLF